MPYFRAKAGMTAAYISWSVAAGLADEGRPGANAAILPINSDRGIDMLGRPHADVAG
jgi:hypothetical protein